MQMADAVVLEFTEGQLQQAQRASVRAAQILGTECASLSNSAAELAAKFSLAAATTAGFKDLDEVTHAQAWTFAGALTCLVKSLEELLARTTCASQDAQELDVLVGKAEQCALQRDRERGRCKRAP